MMNGFDLDFGVEIHNIEPNLEDKVLCALTKRALFKRDAVLSTKNSDDHQPSQEGSPRGGIIFAYSDKLYHCDTHVNTAEVKKEPEGTRCTFFLTTNTIAHILFDGKNVYDIGTRPIEDKFGIIGNRFRSISSLEKGKERFYQVALVPQIRQERYKDGTIAILDSNNHVVDVNQFDSTIACSTSVDDTIIAGCVDGRVIAYQLGKPSKAKTVDKLDGCPKQIMPNETGYFITTHGNHVYGYDRNFNRIHYIELPGCESILKDGKDTFLLNKQQILQISQEGGLIVPLFIYPYGARGMKSIHRVNDKALIGLENGDYFSCPYETLKEGIVFDQREHKDALDFYSKKMPLQLELSISKALDNPKLIPDYVHQTFIND